MQTGYVLCSPDLLQVLCLNEDHTGVNLVSIETTRNLNQAICLSDVTEAKNVSERLHRSGLVGELDIINVARLYKRFF
jgi:hypothetical protein